MTFTNSSLTGPRIKLDYATYVGTSLGNGVDQFLGMRYAAPPVGNLRWRAPAPPAQQGIELAQEFKNFCIGTSEKEAPGVGEDCLYVNVWKPTDATRKSKLPVWVFIQGGGYNQNWSPNYNGSEVVETSGHSIVQVNFNYRVGVYGFFAGKAVEEHGDLNNGLRDQIALLQWVQENISEFGGDPEHVVIHGSSAGAGSVALHLISPRAATTTLFAGGIMESVFVPQQPRKTELEWQYDRFVKQLGCASDSAEEEMLCLRGRDINATQEANVPSPFPESSGAPFWYWVPVIDGDLIPDEPLKLFARGEFTKVPMIIGNNQNEGVFFVPQASTPQEVTAFMDDNYPRLTSDDNAKIAEYYPLMEPAPPNAPYFPSVEQAYGEATLICPAISILEAIRNADAEPAWSYRNHIYDDFYASIGFGTPHGYEEGAIFGPNNTNNPGRYTAPESLYTYNAPLVPVFMDYWISFVRTLSPNPYRSGEAPEWHPWNESRSKLLIELDNLHMESVGESQFERCEFWEGIDRSLSSE
ncbi:Alpha/Beta hydrolase protein [Dactylonectria estremocensis]|uniref:Carboxylic ester hydrolase n=1 Tax=Dactylonectria estremocensis TaxID=1079267 RepID=A0A9P9DAJ0_9HYPO|nr:Alpha/Beta hydrolase protein [Dactylonectria estremocensis]